MGQDLIIPVYLDTNSLLDLLAAIEGGFSVVEKLTSQSTASTASSRVADTSGGAEFGTPNFLNLLKLNVNISASGKRENTTGEQQVSEREKYHTYGSLFHRLRQYLAEQSLIKHIGGADTEWSEIRPSDFVEVHGTFCPNPLVDSLEIMAGLLRFFEVANQLNRPNVQATASQSGRKSSGKTQSSPMADQVNPFRSFIQEMLNDLERGQTRAFVVEIDNANDEELTGYRAVAVVFLDYLRDKTMYEISHKQYHMLGKVVRKIEKDNDEQVDLLRGAALQAFPDGALQSLFDSMSNIPDLKLPRIETRIEGPVVEIIPIAIFV